jgi:hypothetical protein
MSIRIFVSFDGDHDVDLLDRLHSDLMKPGSTFELCARSRGRTMSEAWTESSRTRIRAADEVVVICGEYTDASERMAAELRITQEEHKPYVLVWGRRERMCTKPAGARRDDAMYSWSRDILETQMNASLRNAKPFQVPESCKRQTA